MQPQRFFFLRARMKTHVFSLTAAAVMAGTALIADTTAVYAVEKLAINPEAQAKAIADARKIVPDTLQLDFSEAKEIYLDEYRILNDFEDGMLCVQDVVTGKCGFLDTEGEWAIPISLNLATAEHMCFHIGDRRLRFRNGYCVYLLATKKNEYKSNPDLVVIDKKGNITPLPSAILECSDFTPDGYALAVKKYQIDKNRSRKKLVFINPQGQEIMTGVYSGAQYLQDENEMDTGYKLEQTPRLDYEAEIAWGWTPVSACAMSDGLSPYFDYVSRLWGFFNKTGKKVIHAKYKHVHAFFEGLAAVQMPTESSAPEKWGFINPSGQMVISPRFSIEPSDFHYGRALVQKVDETLVYIDKTGKVVSPEYDRALDFYYGYALVRDPKTWTYCCVNPQFEIVNTGDNCWLQDNEYFWRGRQISGYESQVGRYDFIGRKTAILDWEYKGKKGDRDAILITSGPMLEINAYSFRAYADLNGKVKFVLLRNEF